MAEVKNTKQFIAELLEYYKMSMSDIAVSIQKLSEIQKKYALEYEDFKNVSERPEILLTLDLNDQEKNILFELLLKSSSLINKISKLLSLTPTEKEELSKDIKAYTEELSNKIKEISIKK